MPPRIARSSVPQTTKKQSGKRNKKRHLDAFAIAGKLAPEKTKVRGHRLGEIEEEPTRSKRRRSDEDEDEEQDSEDDRSKRRRRQADNDDDDVDVEYGSDSEGNEWVIGEVNDDDDESLDSDMAFGESDEERFEGFTFRGSSTSKKPMSKRKPVTKTADEPDLDEDEDEDDEEGDDFGDEGVDLATMLDDENEEDEADEADDADSESENTDEEPSEYDDEEERHARLQDFVEGLGTNKSTKPQQDTAEEVLTLEDLLHGADLDDNTLATLKPKKKSKAPELVKSTLPKRQQDTIDRKIATTKAKEQLDRWQDSVIHNRRSEFLSFPLRNPDETQPTNRDTFVPTQQVDPSTELERNIRQIMEESGMLTKGLGEDDANDGLLRAEAMAANRLPVEEVVKRRAELRRMRILLDREEIKAKRIAKIKSKAYRRVHRKERERLADKERMLLDPETFANGELMEDEQEEADRRRAIARMNAKHKDSKWAKSLRATDRAHWDDDARVGVMEQARRQEELKRRIAGRDDVDEIDDDDDDEDDDDDDDLSVQDKLTELMKPDATEKKGLAALAFMQKSEIRRKAENDAALASLQRELDPEVDEHSEIEDNGLGRAIFGPKREVAKAQAIVKKPVLEEGSASEDESTTLDHSVSPVLEARKDNTTKVPAKKGSGPLSKAAGKAVVEEPVAASSTSVWLKAPKGKKSKLDRKLARDADNDVVIDTQIDGQDAVLATPVDRTAAEKEVGSTDGWATVTYNNNDVDEAQREDAILSKEERNAAFHARAFAGDDVAVAFAAEKDALIASEDEREESTAMPGWGSWAGAGLSKAAKRAAERARHNPLYKTKTSGTRPQNRKDAKLENVIISEKSDRKGKRYLAPILPHQFERKEEYERSLGMPLGPEWTTKEVFQKNTRPRVVVKPGTIIEPMSRPIV